jgi:hypothetical protein
MEETSEEILLHQPSFAIDNDNKGTPQPAVSVKRQTPSSMGWRLPSMK